VNTASSDAGGRSSSGGIGIYTSREFVLNRGDAKDCTTPAEAAITRAVCDFGGFSSARSESASSGSRGPARCGLGVRRNASCLGFLNNHRVTFPALVAPLREAARKQATAAPAEGAVVGPGPTYANHANNRPPRPTPRRRAKRRAQDRQACEAALAELARLGERLAAARTAAGSKAIRDRAEALRLRHRQRRGRAARQVLLASAELKVRAERALGAWLAQNVSRGGDHRSQARSRSILRRLGIDRHQSSKWQLAARLPESRFESLVREMCEKKAELTTAAVLRLVRPPRGTTSAPASSGLVGRVSDAGLNDRLAEIHRHTRQVQRLIAPALDGQPSSVQPFVWRQIARLIRETGRLSDLESPDQVPPEGV
jgi:hypothetical protein